MWIALGALGTAMAIFYRNYVLYSQYDNPPALKFYPVAFEYIAFAMVAFLFPWSWRNGGENLIRKIALSILTAFGFVIAYVFVLNYLEWTVRNQSYDFWISFRFTVLHSGLYAFVIYSIICILLYHLGFVNNSKNTESGHLDSLPYRMNNKTSFIPLDKAILFESDGNYVDVHLVNGQRYPVRTTLRRLEKQLDPNLFQRIHRRHIINLSSIKSYKSDYHGGYIVYLNDNRELRISKTYSATFRRFLRKK